MPKKYGYKNKQEQISLLAHNKILEFENFRYLLETLEEYIEKTGYYPDFKNKRQLQNITIPKEKNYSLDNCENLFRTKLLLFVTVLESGNTPDTTKKEIQEEFYKWINIVGIDAKNCRDEKLRHFLLEINNVLEGNSEKIIEQARRYVESVEDERKNQPIDLKDAESALGLFNSLQRPMNDKMEQAELYKDKNYFEVEIKDKFGGGSKEQGKQVFNQLTSLVSNNDFHFFRQKGQPINPQQQTNSVIVQDVKQNPRSWRIDEIVTGYDNRGRAVKKEKALIHNFLAEVSFDGVVSDAQQPVYLANRFNQNEIAEINQALNISQTPNYDNWTKEQFIAEIERLKVENEWLKNNQTLTSSERQTKIQQNQQKLEQFNSYVNTNSQLTNSSNGFPANLAIGGTVLAVIGLVSFLVTKKVKKQS